MTTSKFSLILLAGGTGSRMKSSLPKQFLPLQGKPIALYSLDLFLTMPETAEVVVVCDPALRHYFNGYNHIKWALPGERRQDSVYNGLEQTDPHQAFICVHDACRPFIDQALVRRTYDAARQHGAASAGVPVRYTVKEIDNEGLVVRTPDRSFFWEIQTPQIVSRPLLEKGFCKISQEHLTVTDDTSIAELAGSPVKLVEGSYANIKITTPDDLATAEVLMKSHGQSHA